MSESTHIPWCDPLQAPWICDTCGEAYTAIPWACCGTAEFHRRHNPISVTVMKQQPQQKRTNSMTEEQRTIVKRMALVIAAYGVQTELAALPTDNPTMKSLQQRGDLLCRWANALAYDLTPPEQLDINTDRLCVNRMTEHAMTADSCAYKATQTVPGDWCTKLIGQKKQTLPQLLQYLYDRSVDLQRELALQT